MMPTNRFAALVASLAVLCVSPATTQRTPPQPSGSSSGWDVIGGLAASTPAVSGFEHRLVDSIRRTTNVQGGSVRVDEIGNLILTVGTGSPHLLVTTSVDEDGHLVSDITPDGYLRLHRVSTGATFRLFDQFLYGQPVVISTASGREVPGVVGSMSAHLQRGRDQAVAAKGLDDMWVDVGAESAADVGALGIRLLDPVTLRERGTALAGRRAAAVASQARGCAGVLSRLLAVGAPPAGSIKGTLTIAWTVQGQFGERGLARLAREVTPDRVIVLTRTALGREADPRGAFGRLGSGPVLAETDTALLEKARTAGIPFQTVPTLRAPRLWPSAVVEAVALPTLFSQTPVETVDQADIAALDALLRAVIGLPPPGGVVGSIPGTVSEAAPGFAHLASLVEAYGVSGHETAVRQEVERRLPTWAKPAVDAKGNLTVSFGSGGRELLFVAHTDELGCEVTQVREDGTAGVRRCGVFNASMEAHPVIVHTASTMVPAVVAPRPGYATAGEWQPKPEEMSLYFGTDSKASTEALGVKPGDTVTVRKRFERLGAHRATARSIDDRAGCAALLSALERLDPAKVKNRITVAWDVEEETGLTGAGLLAERMKPDYVFAVDTFVSSDTPIDPRRYARVPLGSGAVLRAVDSSSITPPDLVATVQQMAAARGIPVSVGMTTGGNDGSQFGKVGSRLLPLSWPGRYSHSAVEVIDGRDLKALVDLIVMLATEWGG